jgi:LacI family transcriptional regulator
MIDHRGPIESTPSVSVDNKLGGELAAAHLVSIGRKRLAFVGGPTSIQQIAERLAGARSVVERADGVSFEHIATETRDAAAGRLAAEQILRRPLEERPDGVFCVNDTVAIGMLQRFGPEPSASVPHDIALVGYNDVALERYPSLPLTSIRQPHEKFGETAIELLLSKQPTNVVFAPELIVRASTVGEQLVR